MANREPLKDINGRLCVSTAILAQGFGVTSKTIAAWEKKGCPKAAYGYWDLAQVIAWREGQNRNEYNNKDVSELPITLQKTYWETRCKEEQAENQKFKNAIIREDHIEKSLMEQELSTFFVEFKQAALALPRKMSIIAAQYLGNERARKMENDMTEVVVDALRQWSRGDFSMDAQGIRNTKASRKNNSIAVGGSEPHP